MLHRRFRITLAPGLMLALLIALGLAGCGASAADGGGLYGSSGGSGGTSTNTPGPGSGQTTCASGSAAICTRSVQVNGSAKQALVTSSGRTLYYFTSDTATTSACSGECVSTWPPLMASSAQMAPIAGLPGALTTISRSGGAQIVYNGHPLYTYSADQAPGDTKGEGLFGKWFVATPDLAPAGSNDNNNGYSNGY